PQQPLLLLVADVREVPHQRRHQRRVLRGQVGSVDATGEQRGAVPGGDERGDRALARRTGVEGGVGHEGVSFPCGNGSCRGGPSNGGCSGLLPGAPCGGPSSNARASGPSSGPAGEGPGPAGGEVSPERPGRPWPGGPGGATGE